MTKVCSIVPYNIFPAKVGGQKGIAIFNEYLAKEVELVCVTVKSNTQQYAHDYAVLNILSDKFYKYINPFYFFTVRNIIRKQKASHLLLEHPYFGWLGILLKRSAGVKLIIHSHNIEAKRWKSLGKWWWKILWHYERLAHRNADYNFFIQDSDREYAVQHFGLQPSACITATYGIEFDHKPTEDQLQAARLQLRQKYDLDPGECILLFNGAFNYKPNLSALQNIIDHIDPPLQQKNHFSYKIIICGRDIPEELVRRKYSNIIIAGFVDDIGLYFKGADIFLNPVNEGGGIKTKLVEALAYNMNAVSTVSGAIGINPFWCNEKLLLSDDGDWEGFAELIIKAARIKQDISPAYFKHFYWGNTAKKIASFIK